MKKIAFVALVAITLLAACGKDKTTTTTSTTLTTTQKIQNKWNIVHVKDINYLGQTSTVGSIDTFPGTAGDFIEFKTNNMAYVSYLGTLDTIPYSILSDSKMKFDSDTFTINTLTTNSFIYTYYDRVSTDYYDNIITLSR